MSGLQHDLRLLEVDADLLAAVQYGSAAFKGNPDTGAVLCTASKTFTILQVETTNCLYLIPDSGACSEAGPISITARAVSHLEPVEVAPDLDALHAVLRRTPWRGRAGEGATPCGCTFPELLSQLQMSDTQLREGLRECHFAFQVGDRWRRMDPTYFGEMLQLVLASCQEAGWPLEAVPAADLVESLSQHEYEPEEVAHCMERICHTSGQQDPPSGLPAVWQVNEGKVCRALGRAVLSKMTPCASEDFLAAWQEALPDGCCQVNVSTHMAGHALTDPQSGMLKLFSVDDLPTVPSKRFAALFAERERWLGPELQPYLEGLREPGCSADALLLRFTRASQVQPSDPISYTDRFRLIDTSRR